MKKNLYDIEVTDTFEGEANYCWVRRYQVRAVSMRGAANALSRREGGYWCKDFDCGDMARYNMRGACICAFISWAEEVAA